MVDFSVVLWIPYLTFPPRSSQSQSRSVAETVVRDVRVSWFYGAAGTVGWLARRVVALPHCRVVALSGQEPWLAIVASFYTALAHIEHASSTSS